MKYKTVPVNKRLMIENIKKTITDTFKISVIFSRYPFSSFLSDAISKLTTFDNPKFNNNPITPIKADATA